MHNKPVPAMLKMADTTVKSRRSKYSHHKPVHIDRTHSLDHATAVAQHQEAERRLSAAAIEIGVSFATVVKEFTHS